MKHKIDHARVILTVLIFVACAAAVIALDVQGKKYTSRIQIMSDENATLQGQVIEYWDRAWEAEQELAEIKSRDVIAGHPVEYITKEVIREIKVPVETIVYRNIYAREFESVSQFREWAEPKLTILWITGVKTDCDDYAEQLQIKALVGGYTLSCVVIEHGLLLGRRVSPITGLHMGNLLMTDTDIYYVEPQPDIFDVVWVCARD